MQGRIAELIAAPWPRSREAVSNIFGPKFQDMDGFRSFLRVYLRSGSVTATLSQDSTQWTVESFQALYIACWIHQPLEKGTFMINLGTLSAAHQENIRVAHKKVLSSRPSSHLSGSGASASKGWNFLKNYHELLVQMEETRGTPFLMLKAEGHTTGITGIVPHMRSWLNKLATGKGNTANQHLKNYANLSPQVAGRAAENYGMGYEKLVNSLGLHDKLATVRELMYELFKKVGYPPNTGMGYQYFDRATNAELGQLLKKYIAAARQDGQLRSLSNWSSRVGAAKAVSQVPVVGHALSDGSYITDKALNDLSSMATALEQDGDVIMDRVYEEVRVNPLDLEGTLEFFYAQTDYGMPDYLAEYT